MDTRQEALYYFRNLVYCLYREIGVLTVGNHPELARKAKLESPFFSNQRKTQAKQLYHQTTTEGNPRAILKPYEDRTGLSLQDLYRIFDEGNWRNTYGSYSFGGPKWARIAKETIALYQAIDEEDLERVPALIHQISTLRHNTDLVVRKFQPRE
jgi:hypothetical protein